MSREWQNLQTGKTLPTFNQLLEFLNNRY